MLLSLQLFRRYKQHLANSAPNGSKCSELQGLILCYPPSIYTGFTQALHWGDRKHFHSHRLAPGLWPGSLALPWPAVDGEFLQPRQDTKLLPASAITRPPGWGRQLQGRGLHRWAHLAHLPEEKRKPRQGCANVCPETNNMHFKICIYGI